MTEKINIALKIQYIDEDNNLNLHYAAATGNLEDVKEEIANGNEIDPINFLGWTPLLMATRNGHIEVVKYLLEKRADSTKTNKFGYNIFILAVATEKINLIKTVLQHLLYGGISKTIIEKFLSPVAIAILTKNQQVIQYLLDQEFSTTVTSFIAGLSPKCFVKIVNDADISKNLLLQNENLITTETEIGNQQNVENLQPYPYIHSQPIPQPMVVVTPQPFTSQIPICNLLPGPQLHYHRKCSELLSPVYSPGFSPVTPIQYVSQLFFPPNFSPNHLPLPCNQSVPFFAHEDLNQRIIPSPLYSPHQIIHQ